MATGETGFDDVTFDLISVQYHSLKAGHDYGQYVRDARNAGEEDIAAFFEEVMAQDSERAHGATSSSPGSAARQHQPAVGRLRPRTPEFATRVSAPPGASRARRTAGVANSGGSCRELLEPAAHPSTSRAA
jgi:hypothetical protein